MSRRRASLGGSLAALAALGAAAAVAAFQQATFPHEEHARLFPVCAGCHGGIATGDAASSFPMPETCARCHDGQARDRVAWSGREPRTSNVRFDHVEHVSRLEAAGDATVACESCHSTQDTLRMSVTGEVQLDTCFGCHAHEAASHYEDADCSTCHAPLARSGFSTERIQALPVPADHETEAFVEADHGLDTDPARCATCHTSERCAACHVNAASLAAIGDIPSAPPELGLPDMVAHYPTPAAHRLDDWLEVHGLDASVASCATCHTSDDCRSCHVEPVPAVVGELTSRAASTAPGAELEPRAPATHASPFFLDTHPVYAASGDVDCATCHTESFCVSCHDGPVGGGYHPPDFVARHAADAFVRTSECANCHNTEAFCRGCHVDAGLTASSRLGPGFHATGSLWLLRHGQAARQNLESCASCHSQPDCTQCHSTVGAFQVSPHSADFDAVRAWEQNPRTCLACHLRNPIGGAA